MDDAEQAEKLIRNLARRLERDAPGVSQTLLEGLDEILTVIRLGLPTELRRSLACTNIIENMMGTVRSGETAIRRDGSFTSQRTQRTPDHIRFAPFPERPRRSRKVTR